METIIEQIERVYPTLSKGQKAIADYIMENYEAVAYMTAARIGKATGVSESTVVRFATELGFSGFPHFQHQLRDDLKVNLTAAQRMKTSEFMLRHADDVLGAVLMADHERLRRAYEHRDVESFNQAVESIGKARRVYILGLRSSAPLASYLSFYLSQIHDDVHLICGGSPGEMFEQLLPLSDQDLLLVLSFPRYASRIVKALSFAKSMGARTVVITDKQDNPFTEYSDCTILAPSDMASFVDALVVPFSTVTALIVAVAQANKDVLIEHLVRLESIWQQYDVYEKIERRSQPEVDAAEEEHGEDDDHV